MAQIRLPDLAKAPGYRDSLATRSKFAVEDFGDNVVGVAPTEGAGATREYFKAVKLCDAGTDLSDPVTWQPLRDNEPSRRDDIDLQAFRSEMLARGKKIKEENPGFEGEVVAFALAAYAAGAEGEMPHLLKSNLPVLFKQFPSGELWYVTTSPVLLARLAFMRAELAFQLTPDIPLGENIERFDALSELSLTKGIDIAAALNVGLLTLSPFALGLLMPAMPHALAFCFGTGLALTRPYPISFASLYRPSVLNNPAGLDRSFVQDDIEASDGPQILNWWVCQLNRIYSHASDPTRFTDQMGHHDPSTQAAWMITFERLIADANSLLAEPQATDLDRAQIAFDLLDKAESLLGYDSSKSGKGFKALLRRSQCLPRLKEALASLPDDLPSRLIAEAEQLFDGLYDNIRANTARFRTTEKGARVASESPSSLKDISDDQLVSSLCRAVRNSSHGLLDILRDRPERFVLAVNTGGIPAELPALAPLIALGLIADAEGLIDGTWRAKLIGADT